MPNYDYECYQEKDGCGHLWEEFQSIEDRMVPMNAPCPKCGKVDTIIRHINHAGLNGLSATSDILSAKNMDPEVRERIEVNKNLTNAAPETNRLDW